MWICLWIYYLHDMSSNLSASVPLIYLKVASCCYCCFFVVIYVDDKSDDDGCRRPSSRGWLERPSCCWISPTTSPASRSSMLSKWVFLCLFFSSSSFSLYIRKGYSSVVSVLDSRSYGCGFLAKNSSTVSHTHWVRSASFRITLHNSSVKPGTWQ